MEGPEQAQLMEKEEPKTTPEPPKNPFGLGFALIFTIGFGAALLYAAGTNWSKSCDQPLKDFLTGFGVTGVFAALVFFGLEMTNPKGESLSGFGSFMFWVVLALFFAFGVTGSVFYWDSEDCETLAAIAHRWTFAGVLLFIIITGLIVSSLFGKFGGPFFAIFGFLLGNLFQFLADLFKGLAETLSDDGDPENKPPKRSAASDFALYVNHGALMWFFAYILYQAYDERDDPCDKPLHRCLHVFSFYGIAMTYLDFLFEKFAGIKTREKLKPHFRFLWGINILAYVIWGIYTCDKVFTADTCKDTAKDVFRLSFLLSCVFLVFCGFLVLGILAGILDFLCSGRLRFVVVIETGDDEEA